jgi:hypothetical protein
MRATSFVVVLVSTWGAGSAWAEAPRAVDSAGVDAGAVKALKEKAGDARWEGAWLVADLDGDGKDDYARLGRATRGGKEKYVIGVAIARKATMVTSVLVFGVAGPTDGAVEDAVGPNARLFLEPPASPPECAGDAACEKARAEVAANAAKGAKGIALSDGTTDAIHIAWNPVGRALEWWRR